MYKLTHPLVFEKGIRYITNVLHPEIPFRRLSKTDHLGIM